MILKKILVANRGEIAVRVMRACREMGIVSVAAYSDADEGALFARYADEAICIGPPPARLSYLNIQGVIEAARESGADAITVHARSREQRYNRAADWDLIGRVAAERGVPVIGNGDILTHYEARERMARSGVGSGSASARTEASVGPASTASAPLSSPQAVSSAATSSKPAWLFVIVVIVVVIVVVVVRARTAAALART